jgi:hypothetical protein
MHLAKNCGCCLARFVSHTGLPNTAFPDLVSTSAAAGEDHDWIAPHDHCENYDVSHQSHPLPYFPTTYQNARPCFGQIVEGVQGMEVRPSGPHRQGSFQPVIVDPVRLLNAARKSCESQIVTPSDSCHAEHSRILGSGLFEPRASLVVI